MAGLVAASTSTKPFNHLHLHTVRNNRQQTADELWVTEAAGLFCHSSPPLMSLLPFAKESWLEGVRSWTHRQTQRFKYNYTVFHATPHHIHCQSQLLAVADACS